MSALLDIGLELPVDQRETWLESLAGDDTKLVPIVRDFMAHNTVLEKNEFLARLPEFSPLRSELCDDDALAPGTRVGPYVLIKLIGRGGMSTVFLASRVDGQVKRNVALKLPHGHLLVPRVAERFERERDILAALTHPNIGRLYDAGISDEGLPYLAMEHVDGTPLIDYCNRGSLGIEPRLELFQQVLAAVRHAHSKLVLHRDLKPSNILVTNEGRVLLLDFGIAKLIELDGTTVSDATRFGGRALTPAYASPEQISGEHLGTPSDVYSLGVILYELLTGQRPYRLARQSAAAVEEAILNTDAPHLSESIDDEHAKRLSTTSAKLGQALRGDLDAIVRKALRKPPALRYGTAEEFARDLAAYAMGEPVSAHAESRSYLLRKFVGRHKGAFGATIIVFIALTVGGAAALISARVAIVQRDRALALASRNEAISVFLKYLIADAAESDKPVTISDMLKRSEALVMSENRGNPDHQAAVLDMLGMEYRTTGEYARAEALTRHASDLVRESHDPVLKAMVSCDHAGALDEIQKKPEAEAILRAVLREDIGDPRVTADCLEELADSADDGQHFKEALDLSLAALQQLRQARDFSPSTEAEYIGSVALTMSKNDRIDEAVGYFNDAMARLQALGRGNSGTALILLNDYGVALDSGGNPKQAVDLLNQVLARLATRDPNAQPWVATLINLGRTQERIGRFAEAKATHEKCVQAAKIARQLAAAKGCLFYRAIDELDTAQPLIAEEYINAGIALAKDAPATNKSTQILEHLAVGRLALTRHHLERAMAEYDAILAPQHSGASVSQSALLGRAEVLWEASRPHDSMHDAQAALDLAHVRQGKMPHSRDTGVAWAMIAKLRENQGDHAGARAAAHAAIEQFSDTVDPDLPQLQAVTAMVAQ